MDRPVNVIHLPRAATQRKGRSCRDQRGSPEYRRNCTPIRELRSIRTPMHATAFLKAPDKQATGPAVVLYGAERFLKQEALQALARLVLGGETEELGLVRLPGATSDLKTVVDTLLTVSMWC